MSIWSKYLTPTKKEPTKTTTYPQATTPTSAAKWQMPGMGLIEQPTIPQVTEAPLPAQPFPVRPVAATKTTLLAGPLAQLQYEQLGVPTYEAVPFKDEARVFGQALRYLLPQLGASILSATQGQGGASVVNKDWADKYIVEANEDLDKFVQDIVKQYPSSAYLHEVAQLSRNMAYSTTAMGAGLATGVPIAFLPVPGARVAAWVAGTAASGAVAYEMTTYQIMQLYLELKNAEKIEQVGREITLEEENKLKTDFHDKAVKYGLWEAVPEALSNLLFGQILVGPLGKMIGGPMAAQLLQKLAMVYGEELLTETITQKGQSVIEVEAGLREKRIGWVEAFKEIAPQTFLLTTIMAGAGQVIISSSQAIKKVTDSLKNEIGEEHPLYNEIKQGIETDIESVVTTPETVTGIEPTITEAPTVAMVEEELTWTTPNKQGQKFAPYRGFVIEDSGLSGDIRFHLLEVDNLGKIKGVLTTRGTLGEAINRIDRWVEAEVTKAPEYPSTTAMAEWKTVSGITEPISVSGLSQKKADAVQAKAIADIEKSIQTEKTTQDVLSYVRDEIKELEHEFEMRQLPSRQARKYGKAQYPFYGIPSKELNVRHQVFKQFEGHLAFRLEEKAMGIPEAVTPRVTEVTPEAVKPTAVAEEITAITPEVTKPTVEPEALYIPKKLPTTPPPLTPEGTILGRSDNEWEGFMADLQDVDVLADVAFREDVLRKLGRLPGLRGLFATFGPNVIADTPAGKYAVIRATLIDEGYQKSQGVTAHYQEIGTQKKVFGPETPEHTIKSGPLKGYSVGHIAEHRGRFEDKLTDKQKMWLDRANTVEQAVTEFGEKHDIEIGRVPIEEGGQFATRRVYARVLEDGTTIETGYIGAIPRRPGAKLPTEKHRIFKDEAEAIQMGYRYLPYEEALSLRVLGMYKRVADKKAADWLLAKETWRTTGAPEELILAAEAARLKMRHSQMLLAGLNRAVRGERLPDVTIRAIATSYPAQAQALKDLIPRLQAAKPSAKEIRNLTNVAKGLIDTNKMNYHKAVAARARAREAAMTVKLGEAAIPAPAFAGKILTGSDAKETTRIVMKSFEPSFSKALGEMNKFNAVVRYLMLAGDFSTYQIQLIFMMGENPKAYSKAFAGAIHAMLDPKFHASQLAKFKDVIDRNPNVIMSKGGTTEMTEAMARGGWLSGETSLFPEGERYRKSLGLLLPRTVGKVAARLLTPFQRVFECSLDLAGIYKILADEHMVKTPADRADLGAHINEFRGLISSARMGVSGIQRQRETAALLAPRYNRAVAAWLWSLTRGGLRGRLARRSFARGLTALTIMGVLISLARKEKEEEIIEHFNPNSSSFFTWDIAGQKIGPGSKVRSLIKLFAQSASNPDELLELSMDNPALRFTRGNLAPAAGAAIDIISGRSYIGDPTRDGMLSFSKEILAGNLLPIWVQSTLLEGGEPGGRTARGIAEFFGWRAYPEPLWDEVRRLRDKYAKQDLNMKYEDLNRAQIDKLKDNHPDLDDLEERARLEQAERGNEFELGFYEIRKEAMAARDTALDEAATLLLAGSINKYDYDKERGYVRPYYSGGMSTLYQMRDRLDPKAIKDIEEWLSENQKPEDKAMDEYQEHRASLIEKADLPRDWDEIEAQCEKFLSKYSRKIQEYIKDNLSRWINDLPENAKQIELMRLHGIEDETWWDNYRGVTSGSMWSGYTKSPSQSSGSRWSKYLK